MNPKTKVLELSINDALNNLAALADMDIDINEPIGIVKKHKLVIQEEAFNYKTIDWLIKENAQELVDNIKETYRTLLDYIKQIYEQNFIDWNNYKSRKGFQAIMVMATDAANKVDQYLELLPQQPNLEKINKTAEFKAFKKFYLEKIIEKFDSSLEGKEEWENQWQGNEKSFLLDIEKSGLKDFEILKKDEEYEMFNLVDNDEKPFFDAALIKNIKLFCTYEEKDLEIADQDPLLKSRVFLDRDFQLSAKQILDRSKSIIDKYFLDKLHQNIESELSLLVNKVLYALMLAANPKNLIKQTFFKNCIEYFHDFQTFLREVLSSEEYQKIVAYPDENKQFKYVIDLVHTIVFNLFLRSGGVKQEIIGFIHSLIRQGDEMRKFKYPQKMSFWNNILENDESIQVILSSYPNGPLMKLLDAIRNETLPGFDPIMQENVAEKFFEVDHKNNHLKIIRCPSPTSQRMLFEAEVIKEFEAFLRSFNPNQTYLFVNLQDKDSFRESARYYALEKFQKRSDFKSILQIVDLDKCSEFYHQSGIYLNFNDVKSFLSEFKARLKTNQLLFFTFKSLDKFIDDAFDVIHKCFFVNKNVFTRKNRLDFIEIFYNFFVLKLIEIQNPGFLSFVCKDGIDLGSSQTASFYAFLKMIKKEDFSKKNEDFFRWLVYSSALLVRERPINSSCLIRTVSCLNSIDVEMLVNSSKILKAVSTLYDPSFLKSIEIIEH